MTTISKLFRQTLHDYATPNFIGIESGQIRVELKNFRQQKQAEEFIIFVEYFGELYYPAWQEFRALNNHLLYLISNLQLRDFLEVAQLLESSFEKEEKGIVKIKSMVIRVKSKISDNDISRLVALPGFKVSNPDLVVDLSSSNNATLNDGMIR